MGFDSLWTSIYKVSNNLWFQSLQIFRLLTSVVCKYLLTYISCFFSFSVLIFTRFFQTFHRVTFQRCVCRKLRGILSRNRPSFFVILNSTWVSSFSLNLFSGLNSTSSLKLLSNLSLVLPLIDTIMFTCDKVTFDDDSFGIVKESTFVAIKCNSECF